MMERKVIDQVESGLARNSTSAEVILYDAMKMMKTAWNTVTEDTNGNCFRKTGSKKRDIAAVTPGCTDYEFTVEETQFPDITHDVLDQVDFEDFVTIDSRILTSEILSDTEIASNVHISTEIENVSFSDEEDDQGEPEVMVRNLVAEQHLEELKKIFFSTWNGRGNWVL